MICIRYVCLVIGSKSYHKHLIRMMNKLTDKYLSSTMSTTERHFGLKTKEMSMVRVSIDAET